MLLPARPAPTPPQGRPLLASKTAASDARGYISLPLVNGIAQLPDLSVTGGLRWAGWLLA